MRIGICDDEAIIREEIMRLCKEYTASNIFTLETITFSSGDELLQYKESIDILFLDIQMKGLNGLKTAERIREKDDNVIIIFLTGYKGFMQEGYRVRAFRYLLKPIKEQEFNRNLKEALEEIVKDSKTVVSLNGNTIFVKLKDIIYIEYENRYTLVRTRRDVYESTYTMSEWENMLDTGDFYRVHKAFIVNMEYIEEIGKTILLENGEKVEVAVRQIAKLKKACKAYRKRNAK